MLFKKNFMVESLLLIGAGDGVGVGAGEKTTGTRSRSKMERLRNTADQNVL